MPRAAIILLMKNERDLIPAYLANHHAGFDEIVVVDDESTDGSHDVLIEQAKILGCSDKIIYVRRALADNFAGQRNVAQGLTTCEWVIHADADEIIPLKVQLDLQNIIGKLDASGSRGCAFSRMNCIDGVQTKAYPDYIIRLVRRDIKWRNRIHETPDLGGNPMVYGQCDTLHYKTSVRQSDADRFYSHFPEQPKA
jgi:glycosyltransferase involved in cell wall biosynthesis